MRGRCAGEGRVSGTAEEFNGIAPGSLRSLKPRGKLHPTLHYTHWNISEPRCCLLPTHNNTSHTPPSIPGYTNEAPYIRIKQTTHTHTLGMRGYMGMIPKIYNQLTTSPTIHLYTLQLS